MTSVGTAQPGETAREGRRREAGRDLFTMVRGGMKSAPSTSQNLFGTAPNDAERAIKELLWQHNRPNVPGKYDPHLKTAFDQGGTNHLKGLLALIVSYLKLAHTLAPEYPKAIAPLMARTDFARLFNMLPQGQRIMLRTNDNAYWNEVCALAVGLPMDKSIFTKKPTFVPELTRELWCDGIARGYDLLTRANWEQFAMSQLPTTPPSPQDLADLDRRMGEAEWLESLGSYGTKTENAGGTEAALFELRNIPNMMAYTDIKKIAVSLAKYIKNLNQEKDKYYGE
jgi:hypothetical protein